MIKLEKYLGDKTYVFNSGAIATPEIIEQKYPAVTLFTTVVITDELGQVFGGYENLAKLRSQYAIDPSLTEAEAIAELETLFNTPVISEPTADERIAAALEYQNLLTL